MSGETVQKEAKGYLVIFFSLLFLTLISVAIHYLHLPTAASIFLILTVAACQATLSACYLMHLLSEKKLIYFVLILTAFFFVSLVGLTLFSHSSIFEGMSYVH